MRFFMLWMLLLVPGISLAAAGSVVHESPHQKIDRVTVQMVTLIKEAKGYYDKEPERYHQGIEKIMDSLIDFPSFARSVMGPYATKEYLASLKTQEERDAYKANYSRFVIIFRKGLVNTYGKGMLAFNGQNITLAPLSDKEKELVAKGETIEVVQTIRGEKTYKVIYKMRPDKSGEWLLRNVIIGSVNLGSLYRNQFTAAMDKHNNDFGKVVDTWVTEAQLDAESAKDGSKAKDDGQKDNF
jgi:phospholipid transport system substrate-binding protein